MCLGPLRFNQVQKNSTCSQGLNIEMPVNGRIAKFDQIVGYLTLYRLCFERVSVTYRNQIRRYRAVAQRSWSDRIVVNVLQSIDRSKD